MNSSTNQRVPTPAELDEALWKDMTAAPVERDAGSSELQARCDAEQILMVDGQSGLVSESALELIKKLPPLEFDLSTLGLAKS